MTRCKVCNLPKDTLETVEDLLHKGTTATGVREWLLEQGHQISVDSIGNHRRRHMGPKKCLSNPETPQVLLGAPGLSSAQAHLRVIKAHLEHCDRLIGLTAQVPNIRVERLLSESLSRAHQMLQDVSYEAPVAPVAPPSPPEDPGTPETTETTENP